jgi:hypothetical protein
MSIAPAERVEMSLEELAGLEFDFAPKCEWDEDRCENAAKWWTIQPCCGARYTACDPHVQEWILTVARSPNLLFECVTCGTALWATQIRFEPIKAKP